MYNKGFLLLRALERLKAPGELGGRKCGEEITVNKNWWFAVKKKRNENMVSLTQLQYSAGSPARKQGWTGVLSIN